MKDIGVKREATLLISLLMLFSALHPLCFSVSSSFLEQRCDRTGAVPFFYLKLCLQCIWPLRQQPLWGAELCIQSIKQEGSIV